MPRSKMASPLVDGMGTQSQSCPDFAEEGHGVADEPGALDLHCGIAVPEAPRWRRPMASCSSGPDRP